MTNITVEETSLEDLILLGNDKLINISIEFPTEKGNVKTSAKIKQMTMKEVKNINVKQNDLETSIQILKKALFTKDEKPFEEEMILALPVGVVYKLSEEIMRVSGVETDVKKP